MINYNWTIAQCEHEVATGGITIAHWRCTAEDGDHTASAYGTASFTPDPNAPDFVPYKSLTEDDVLGWVKDALDADEIEANLVTKIDAQKNPVSAAGLPWEYAD